MVRKTTCLAAHQCCVEVRVELLLACEGDAPASTTPDAAMHGCVCICYD